MASRARNKAAYTSTAAYYAVKKQNHRVLPRRVGISYRFSIRPVRSYAFRALTRAEDSWHSR